MFEFDLLRYLSHSHWCYPYFESFVCAKRTAHCEVFRNALDKRVLGAPPKMLCPWNWMIFFLQQALKLLWAMHKILVWVGSISYRRSRLTLVSCLANPFLVGQLNGSKPTQDLHIIIILISMHHKTWLLPYRLNMKPNTRKFLGWLRCVFWGFS